MQSTRAIAPAKSSDMHYNYCRIHKTLRVTPAMQAGIAGHLWSIEELVNLLPVEVPKKRGAYKPRKKAA